MIFLNFFVAYMVQKYQNKSASIFYYGKSPKTSRKHLKIPYLQALTLGRVMKMTLYTVYVIGFCFFFFFSKWDGVVWRDESGWRIRPPQPLQTSHRGPTRGSGLWSRDQLPANHRPGHHCQWRDRTGWKWNTNLQIKFHTTCKNVFANF